MSPPGSVPSVVHDQHRWTVFDSKVNLPAALNDPLRVKRETDFFTKTWGQEFYEKMYVPESRYLPDIDRKYFEKYKHRISKVRLKTNFSLALKKWLCIMILFLIIMNY